MTQIGDMPISPNFSDDGGGSPEMHVSNTQKHLASKAFLKLKKTNFVHR